MITKTQFKELVEYYSQFEKKDPPTDIWSDGSKVWTNSNGLRHRENDLPAYIETHNIITWKIDGKTHRTIGPAVIWHNGICIYVIKNIVIKPKDWFKRIMELE